MPQFDHSPQKTPTVDGITGQGTQPEEEEGEGRASSEATDDEIVHALNSFKDEAKRERETGHNPRDDKWRQNLDLYWNRWDFSDKASWQAKEKMPEVPGFVDRFAAALTEALVASPDGFYTVTDPGDKEGDVTQAIKKMTDIWLSTSGRNQNGYPLAFPSVFEEQAKMGALMACSGVVTWKEDVPGGRVAVETVDPQQVWLDSTYRNLYRLRRIEVDKHDLSAMAQLKDSKGEPVFKLPQLNQLVSSLTMEEREDRNRLTGTGTDIASGSSRETVVLDEYIATVLGPDGKAIKEKGLYVVANEQHLIRGPEDNPFWHGRDWLLFAPLSNTPLSVYGRSYMEDFGDIAHAFTELTNMILDAVHTSSLKAFAVAPGYLLNPSQARSGIHGNKMFLLEEGVRPDDFMKALDLGNLPPEALTLWQGMKQELQDAAKMSEVGLGNFAPNSRTSATEVQNVEQSSNANLRSVAASMEHRFLDPMLDLVWKTGLQHAKADDPVMREAVGPEMYDSLIARRRELIKRRVTFQARGISGLMERSRILQSLLQLLQIIGSNELLLNEFLKVADMGKLVKMLFDLSGVPLERMQLSEREKATRSVMQPLVEAQQNARSGEGPSRGEAAGGSGAGGGAQREMASLVSRMGIQEEGSG